MSSASTQGGRLAGKVAIVIGMARGIGAGIARRFAEEGARLVLVDVNPVAGAETARAIGGEAHFIAANLADETAMQALAEETLARFGRIDILMQNAGIYPPSLIEETTLAQWNQVIGLNLTGTFLAIRAVLPIMRQTGGGRIVITSSITGPRVSAPGMAAYAASKAGINGLIRTAALEGARDGITVNGIEPGNIITEGLTAGRTPEYIESMRASVPMGMLGTPLDVANAALFLASDEAAYITGTTIIVDGGQILPEMLDLSENAAWR